MSPSTGRSRTIWIWLLIAAAAIIGILDLIDAMRFLGWNVGFSNLRFFDGQTSFIGAFLSFILAVIWLSVARQLYNFDPRGWLFVVAIATINLIFLFMSLFSGNSFSDIGLNVALNVLALVLGMLPSTKAAFGQQQ